MGQFLCMTTLHVIMLIVIDNDGTFNITWASQYLANQVYERTIMLTHKQQHMERTNTLENGRCYKHVTTLSQINFTTPFKIKQTRVKFK